MADELTPETIELISSEIFRGHKLEAIKLYRQGTGSDLKDSKDFIEQLTQRLREEKPESFSADAKGSGCSSQAGVMLTAVIAIAYCAWVLVRAFA